MPTRRKPLPVRWSFKKGDRILYKTPKGNIKTFIYGKQKWYGHSLPDRSFRYFRGKLEFRQPTLSERFTRIFKSYADEIADNINAKNPILEQLNKFDFSWKQTAVAVPIRYNSASKPKPE